MTVWWQRGVDPVTGRIELSTVSGHGDAPVRGELALGDEGVMVGPED